jgi:hypothetical protein
MEIDFGIVCDWHGSDREPYECCASAIFSEIWKNLCLLVIFVID